jgi:hypothetical protein
MYTTKGYFGIINEHYSELLAREIIIAYDGDVTHQVMKAFTNLVEEKLEHEQEDEQVTRRVYHIMVECLQNINRHAEGIDPHDKSNDFPGHGALLVSKSDTHYRVITANLIRPEQAERLKKFLESINDLSEEELNEMYKNKLMNGKLSPKGGAGIGFIDIRRKTANKMEFNFVENDADTAYFLFNVTISR